MASTIPYTYFQCPCVSNSPAPTRRGGEVAPSTTDDDVDERDFDPRAPRSNYSLYPLEQLLYCEDCQQIRCSKCILEEIVTWYCPNCLFEVPSSSVKSEGTRCTRSCFECPSCTAPLSVTSLEPLSSSTHLGVEGSSSGAYVLSCAFCAWNSREIGIQFDKPNNIYSQLSKIKNGGDRIVSSVQRRLDQEDGKRRGPAVLLSGEDEDPDQEQADNRLPDVRFANLRSFYQSQLMDSSPASALSLGGDYGFGSPSSLSRIMGLYTSGSFSASKPKTKTQAMREAADESEGLFILGSEAETISQLQSTGWEGTATHAQRSNQLSQTRFKKDLRPVPYLLRTKRSKRCKSCRHILTKPESKVANTRFRIRLVALNYIPTMTIKPLTPPATPSSSPQIQLKSYKTTQFLLTLKNPLFEPIKITLATPTHTPGRVSNKVTILCPQFDVGANLDVWDEALTDNGKDRKSQRGEGLMAEAGKVWERGRNWCSVVVEVVPGSLKHRQGLGQIGLGEVGKKKEDDDLLEDEDVLEIPVFVRVEWETDAAQDESGAVASRDKEKEAKEKRELAYWCVLGVGRIVED